MSQAHLNAFTADLDAIKASRAFYRPTINYGDRFGVESSVAGLVRWLAQNLNAPLDMARAVSHLTNPRSLRLLKYMPAIERVVRVWGTAHPYPPIVPSTRERNRALLNFGQLTRPLPMNLRPTWQDLEAPANAMAFGAALGPGYLQRVALGGGQQLDITARSLLLGAGLAPQIPANPTGYIGQLRLDAGALRGMEASSILDVGCGGAFFGAEMRVLFGATTTGIDLHALPVAAIAEGKRRYVRSMLYLKMLRDTNQLPAVAEVPQWAFPLVDRIAENLWPILQAYENNTPHVGDLLNHFTGTALGIRAAGWQYAVNMNVLCYFTAAQQTTAVDGLCAVTGRRVHLYNGSGAVTTLHLSYDQTAIGNNHPGCNIQVHDTRTHWINM